MCLLGFPDGENDLPHEVQFRFILSMTSFGMEHLLMPGMIWYKYRFEFFYLVHLYVLIMVATI